MYCTTNRRRAALSSSSSSSYQSMSASPTDIKTSKHRASHCATCWYGYCTLVQPCRSTAQPGPAPTSPTCALVASLFPSFPRTGAVSSPRTSARPLEQMSATVSFTCRLFSRICFAALHRRQQQLPTRPTRPTNRPQEPLKPTCCTSALTRPLIAAAADAAAARRMRMSTASFNTSRFSAFLPLPSSSVTKCYTYLPSSK